MIRAIDHLIHKYDAATVFVTAATIVVIVELSLMRILVPTSAAATLTDVGAHMEQVYDDISVAKTSQKILAWDNDSSDFMHRLQANPTSWQKQLQTVIAFGFEQKLQKTDDGGGKDRQQTMAADYAAEHLFLQSVMTGRRPLANINGKIYRVGDEVAVRGGEIMMIVSSIHSDYVLVSLDENPEVTRTIYVSRDMQLATGERLP